MDGMHTIADLKEKICLICHNESTKYTLYMCKLDGISSFVLICHACDKTFNLIIQSDKHFPTNSITGICCVNCGKGKDKKWIITANASKLAPIFCSNVCEILMKRQKNKYCCYCDKPVTIMQYCRGCGSTSYCSEKCQKKHWETHKNNCKNNATTFRKTLLENNNKHTCYNCFKMSIKEMKQCASCKKIYYCSKACQKEHWKKEHKVQCPLLKTA